ncbi:MAG: cytochrome c-type biogenesis protein CcmH [Gemmatimonadales bacterium]|jgi:cytochrome c-type biogenesis protein CcmH/NrfF
MWRKSALSLFALALTATSLAAQARGAGPSARDSALSRQLRARPGDSLGRLEVPEAAGRGVAAVTARDNSALVKALEEKIRCTCGCNLSVYTCRTTDFTCTTSPAMHQLVLARLDSGMTEAQVLDAFQKQYGEMIFMSPPKRGFNWAAYLMPFVGLGVGLGLVVGLVKRWGKVAALTRAEPVVQAPEGAATPEEMENLKRELEKFEA